MIVYDVEQRSPEWFALRCGRITATAAADITATLKKGGEPAARRDLRVRLVCERLTGKPQEDGYVSQEMQRGRAKEPDALKAYEALTGEIVSPVGFVSHDSLFAGCSPDGQIDDFRGIVQAKCPKTATHLAYLRAGVVPADYLPQIMHELWITGAEWCDFFSFDDRLPAHLRAFYVRLERDEVDLKSYELLVRMFDREIAKEVEALAASEAL